MTWYVVSVVDWGERFHDNDNEPGNDKGATIGDRRAELRAYLSAGWEPFAVSNHATYNAHLIWLKRNL